MPKVTIVLPTYNGEKYIKKSIDSIINQTYKDWELIIVNDCSNDKTGSIIDKYSQEDCRIHIINNNENKKLPASLNIGFNCASGEYLTWTSDDNYYSDNAIEIMCNFLDKNNQYAMVCCGMNMINEHDDIVDLFLGYEETKMYYNDFVGACFMYRNIVKDEIGGYSTDCFLVEDYEYWLRMLVNGYKIGFINQILYNYRCHKESLTCTRKYEISIQLSKLRSSLVRFSQISVWFPYSISAIRCFISSCMFL